MQTLFSLLGYDVRSTMNGGAERDRTADPLLAKQVLSQLSYSPNLLSVHAPKALHGGGASAPTALGLAKALRLPVRDRNEPGSTTPTVNHQTGAELHADRSAARPERSGQRPRQRQDKTWWARVDSNYRPHAYQACALTD